MSAGNVIVRFDNVTFNYLPQKPLLEEANFSVRENTKITIMGQNGVGKSTIFKMITGELKPDGGTVSAGTNTTIALASQVMPRELLEDDLETFFGRTFTDKPYNLPKRIKDVLAVVNLDAPLDRKIREFSGGQQARLLLAYALIQTPDILLLDEPTNNLDAAGIEHLTQFLMNYQKTCLVISHDESFLNAFTEGILYVDSFTHKVEQYVGDYYVALAEIEAQIERERAKNAQLKRSIQDRKDKINFFSHKGGKMRKLASKLKDQVETAEEEMVEERREDKTINNFILPAQTNIVGAILEINSVATLKGHKVVRHTLNPPLTLRKKELMLIKGPNGIGKSTFLRSLAEGTEKGAQITKDVVVAYYAQDFSGLDFNKTAYEALAEMMKDPWNQEIYATAAQFLLSSQTLKNPVGALSEGQKGLLCYARFVLQKPGLLIMDEPTNHINFRHLPIIAEALDKFEGAVIMVSHATDWLEQITVDQTLDLGAL
ncbi:MAG: ABC-F family ATP-binding cassette domain-containing protein [Candidatus Magasanikbacteria bacterium]|nr:ABC-F family ATP-binding cassette domain-containing protein [Candidatus Magasanikbacteria bacterium]